MVSHYLDKPTCVILNKEQYISVAEMNLPSCPPLVWMCCTMRCTRVYLPSRSVHILMERVGLILVWVHATVTLSVSLSSVHLERLHPGTRGEQFHRLAETPGSGNGQCHCAGRGGLS